MSQAKQTCLVCNCEKSMPLDANQLSRALGQPLATVHTQLCRAELPVFEKALESGEPVLVTCTQEAPLFQEVAEEIGADDQVQFVNIRENAGWSEQGADASAKIAALLKTADFPTRPARLKSIESDGMCLIYGSGQHALDTAKLASNRLSVTLLLSDDAEIVLPSMLDFPIYRGDITTVEGSFGTFSVSVDHYAPLMPSSRGTLNFLMARDGATSDCSLILDMSGNTPLVTGHGKRDGYKRADPGDPAAVLKAVIDLSEMVGAFEKPIYVDYNGDICAHSRSKQAGCSKCLDVCPAGAISDAGDLVAVDSGICGGCGSCYAVCPTGALDYQYPARADTIGRTQALLSAYAAAGGSNPSLLIHDEAHGTEMISALSRFGRGLPAALLPISGHAVTSFGHVELLGCLASGAQSITLLADPENRDELDGLIAEAALTNHIAASMGFGEPDRINVVAERDPDAVETEIWAAAPETKVPASAFSVQGGKRDIARLVLTKLNDSSPAPSELIALPAGAPYGTIEIDQAACTLCMACTSACPTGAMMDTPGEPKLRFTESACVQCSLCINTCPENALTANPRLNLTSAVMQPVTMYEEEPFHCISCDKPFATRSTIDRIKGQLAGKHTMFDNSENARLIEMCDNCRIEAQANSANDPFAAADRPRVRTTEDYLAAEKGDVTPDDFLIDD
ncbi:MAG: 4Fe-4S binding protein [Stappiaceae bacterium]